MRKSKTDNPRSKIRALGVPKRWHDKVMIRAGGRCEVCSDGTDAEQVHHITSKRHLHSAWDKRNGIAVCIPHHDPRTVNDWLERNDPQRHEYRLKQLRTVRHGVKIDPKRILEELEAA